MHTVFWVQALAFHLMGWSVSTSNGLIGPWRVSAVTTMWMVMPNAHMSAAFRQSTSWQMASGG